MKKSYLPILILALLAVGGVSTSVYLQAAKAEEKVDVTIEVKGTDTMMYDKTAFEVKAGQKVKLVFKNIGKLPKAAMGHNLVILKKGVNVATFCSEAIKFGAKE